MQLGKSLKVALAVKGLKRKELAERLSIQPNHVSIWIRTGRISQTYLEDICEALEMPVSEFVRLGEG